LECIVIDGGSTDGTLDILGKYESKIILRSERDRGEADAINKGLKLATGDIVAYIDADDVYEEGAFLKVASFFSTNPGIKWAYGKCKIIDKDGLETRGAITVFKEFWQRRYSYNKLLIMDFIAQPAVFWRRELTDEIGLRDINERLVMDYEYWLRAGAKYNPGFIDEYLASWRAHFGSASIAEFDKEAKDALRLARRFANSNKILAVPQYLIFFCVVFVYSSLNFISRLGSLVKSCHSNRSM
jgi:glycosyltransferase involved in cell wall biosynthesis